MTEKLQLILMAVISLMILIFQLVSFPMTALAEEAAENPDSLSETLALKDRQLFDNSFGNCDRAEINKLIAPDFEFYHDKGGATLSKEAFMQDLATGLCRPKGKNDGYRSFRILKEGSLKSFPLYDKDNTLYGAVQTGEHSFYESYHGGNPQFRSVALFTHLWIWEKGEWLLKRVISYHHHLPAD